MFFPKISIIEKTEKTNCPFCRSEMYLMVSHTFPKALFRVYCQHCDARGPAGHGEQEAVQKWAEMIGQLLN